MIVTPRGLRIYLPRKHAFALMARLYPEVDAFHILETAQGINRIHDAAAFLTGAVCFLLRLDFLHVALWTFVVTAVFYFLRLFGLFVVPGMVYVATLYSRITGFFILTVVLGLIGLLSVGLAGTVAYFGSRLFVEAMTILIDYIAGKRIGASMGFDANSAGKAAMFFAPATDFLRAYQIYAKKLKRPTITDVHYSELARENWIHVWDDLVDKWPTVAERFFD